MIHRGTHLSERDGCKPAETINYGLADNVEKYPLAEQHAAKKALSSVRGCGLVASHMHAHVISVMRWAENFCRNMAAAEKGKALCQTGRSLNTIENPGRIPAKSW